ncbi:FAD-dependent oxidoreductase [Roseiarcaceae bacterium H3SJ34-1]|uniref:FAD-dependent oxidoreductase n=1 Tax=Terripilifer ovatus TaxID=3032367 RepID=UPI003AB995A5|nr:FAD-dependent oxidoreductase [Roseiarcaceae bacterium H3SJ34-1]
MNASDERTSSLWMRMQVAPAAFALNQSLSCDTVVIGSGIAGLSTAYELSQAGQSVIVLDRGPVAGGMTSRTTAHLAPICDDGLSELIKLRGEEMARLFQRSQEAAVDHIEAIVGNHAISCDFRRLDAYLFPALGMDDEAAKEQADREYEAARAAKAEVERARGVPLKGFEAAPVLRYPRQATFHPLKYLTGLVAAIADKGGRLFAGTAVTDIEETADGVRVKTHGGSSVAAARAVVATNSPIANRLALHSKMAPYRTYAMAFTIPRGALPDALYWDMADPYHYVRLQPGPGTVDYLIAGGGDHKSGEADDGDVRFEAIEAWIRQLVPDLGKEMHRWSGQVLDTIDYCGFIGRNPGSTNVFVATGDSGQGMTHGALAGILLRDLIINGSSPWQEVYAPDRMTPAAVLNYVSENLTAVKSFAEYVTPGELKSVDDLKPGEGGIIRDGLAKIAACRDSDGKLHLSSPICTHLGCHVHWNSTEQCWDCPCHGSHFAPDGTVLNGPAIAPLAPVQMQNEAKKAS